MKDLKTVSRVCHEANRVICEYNGDYSQLPWDECPEWQRESVKNGIRAILEANLKGERLTSDEMHENWCKYKLSQGWVWGLTKNEEAKLHPCLVPYDQLPKEQQMKDHMFRAIVNSFIYSANKHVQ